MIVNTTANQDFYKVQDTYLKPLQELDLELKPIGIQLDLQWILLLLAGAVDILHLLVDVEITARGTKAYNLQLRF